jgi:predicted branched-subunit amino acid permease
MVVQPSFKVDIFALKSGQVGDGGRMSRNTHGVFIAGVLDAIPVSVSFFFLFLAVGATCANAGLDALQAVVMTVLVFAAPAQLIIADMVANQNISAVLLTTFVINFRFSVMSAALLPFFHQVRKKSLCAGLAMISASTFGVSFIRYKNKADPLENGAAYRYYLGVSAISFSTAIVSTLIGAAVAARANAAVLEITKLILPLYFATLLAKEWGKAKPLIAAGLGFLCASLSEPLYPNFGLVISAMVVGIFMTIVTVMEKKNV